MKTVPIQVVHCACDPICVVCIMKGFVNLGRVGGSRDVVGKARVRGKVDGVE